uniref:Uncharacterized protein n=1 Tax=Klebsiella quasipneumoniae TaxID=1463165 RepID=A0A6M4NRM9_9ENTR|nr:hypothetical protein [Klebsiella quasipneumoniae]
MFCDINWFRAFQAAQYPSKTFEASSFSNSMYRTEFAITVS